MDIKEYQSSSMRTINKELNREQQLSNMVMGMVGETGEVVDGLKKHLWQGHDLDIDNIKEEIGDVMFYIANLCNVLKINLDGILTDNVKKLEKRYPNGFEVERSVNR